MAIIFTAPFESKFQLAMKERIIIIIVAIIAGLFITSAGFFIYQSTKNTSKDSTSANKDVFPSPTPNDKTSSLLRIEEPKDESLVDRRTIVVKGTTLPNNLVVVSTNQEDISGKPTSDGAFSITISLDAGANKIVTKSITPDGEETEDVRTVTYSTEDF